MDGDGDLDIVGTSHGGVGNSVDYVAWFENDGAADPSWTQSTIATSVDGAHGVHVADLDNDGDFDIVISAKLDYEVLWLSRPELAHGPTRRV